jgi:hypothetical protein
MGFAYMDVGLQQTLVHQSKRDDGGGQRTHHECHELGTHGHERRRELPDVRARGRVRSVQPLLQLMR